MARGRGSRGGKGGGGLKGDVACEGGRVKGRGSWGEGARER